MKTRFLIAFAFLFFIPLVLGNSASACQYIISDNTIQEDFDAFDFIFSGKVLQVGEYAAYTPVTLQVIESWKGQPAEKILLFTCKGKDDGGLQFQEGKSYLIFAEKLSSAYPVVTDFGPTKFLSDAKNDILFLDQKSYITRFHYDNSISISLLAPLKQFKTEISFNDIECKENLVLVKKYNGSPACVKPETVSKLMQREWILPELNPELTPGPEPSPEPTGGFTSETSPRMNDITRDSDYIKTRDSGNMQINNQSELVLSEKELDAKLESLRMAGLPMVSSGVDYDLGVIVIYTPDPTQIDLFQTQLADTPFVLLYEEAPPRWEHDGPEEQKEMPTTTYYDHTRYYEIFTETGPLGLLGVNEKGDVISGSPLLSEINCMRYANWLTEFQKEKIDISEDFPRYPPWGNEIFPLVDYCLANGDLIKTIHDDKIHWEFQLNEN